MATLMQKLEDAVRANDDRRRNGRIERIVWLSGHDGLPSAIMGRTETLHLLREAREVFVDGHFAATLLLAISVINHSLVEDLQLRGAVQRDPGFESVLKESEKLGVLPHDWYSPLRQLAARRHPFVHLKDAAHEHSLGARLFLEKKHPTRLMEYDAQLAIMYMYQVFRATLR